MPGTTPGGDTPLPPHLDPRGRRRARAEARRSSLGTSGVPRPDVAHQPEVAGRTGGPGRGADAGRRPGAQRGRRAARVVAALLSLAILVGSGVAWASYRNFAANIPTGANLPGGADAAGRDQNILLIGNDSRAGASPAELAELSTQNDGGSVNTDTMILLHVPADGSRATLVSFPRDSYVDIPGYGSDRLNAAYADAYNDARSAGKSETAAEGAGVALTAATLSALTGLHIDHYLQVNLLGFYRISQAIGGVQVCLNAAMRPSTSYGDEGPGLDAGFEPDGTYIRSYSGIDLPAGVSTIEGKQALAFVRQRHGLPNGDLDRIARQQYFLRRTFSTISSAGVLLNPFKLKSLLDAVSSSLLKDPSLDLLGLAGQMQALQAGNITSVTMVTTGDQTIDGKQVLGVDPAAVKAQMEQVVSARPDTRYADATPAAAGSVTVAVQNGSGVAGAAAAAADKLRALGFDVPDAAVGNAAGSPPKTVVQYPDGQQAAAKAVAAAVPAAAVEMTSSVTRVTLTLGADGVGVGDPAPSAPATPAPAPTTPAAGGSSSAIPCVN